MNVGTWSPPSWWKHGRTAATVAALLLLVHFARAKDLFGDFCRPAVTFILQVFGVAAVDQGHAILIGRLEVPWNRDCAGLNLLLILLALTIWLNRAEKANWSYWLKIVAAIPAALAANVLRILSLIGYRELFFPQVESPQLHYLLGFLWLLPFVALIVPRGGRSLGHVLLEAFHAAAVVALLTPLTGIPGGDAVTIAVIIALSQCRVQTDAPRQRFRLTMVWMALAALITFLGMESFWLPWLLVCPLLVARNWIFSISGILLTAAAHPLLLLLPGGKFLIWGAIGYFCWNRFRNEDSDDHRTDEPPLAGIERWLIKAPVVAGFLMLPFVASAVFVPDKTVFLPPANTLSTAIAADAFDVRMAGQSDEIGLAWFNPSGNGRHHSMKVCMKYRGVDIEATQQCATVYTEGKRWMREFYLQDGHLLASYPAYILQTLRPGSSPGVHLIYFTDAKQMTAEAFDQSCRKLASQLHNLCLEEKVGANHLGQTGSTPELPHPI